MLVRSVLKKIILISSIILFIPQGGFAQTGKSNRVYSHVTNPGTSLKEINQNKIHAKSKKEQVAEKINEVLSRAVVRVVDENEVKQPGIPDSERIDHEVFDAILRRYVKKSGFFDYKEIRRYSQDVASLRAYVEDLSYMDPLQISDRDEQKAAWLNLYNAIVLLEVIDHYPLKSVLKVKDWYAGIRYKIGEKKYSLMTLEIEIFRKRLRDPRLVFARCFGAQGSPRLKPYAFDGKNIEKQLDKVSLEILKNPSYALLDVKTGRLLMSGFFQFYEKEIGNVYSFVKRYHKQLPAGIKIEYGAFNWNLNDDNLL